MSAFGLNRHTRTFGFAIKNAGGSRLTNKQLVAVELLVNELWGWVGLGQPLSAFFKFVYPLIGGSAIAHSFNLADPATARITWNGTVTHNANGITGNGSTGYGNTGITLESTAIADSWATCGVYTRNQSSVGGAMLSNGNITYDNATQIYSRASGGTMWFASGCESAGPGTHIFIQPTVTLANSAGFFTNRRVSTNNWRCYRNGVEIGGSGTVQALTVSSQTFQLLRDPEPADYSADNLAFVFLTQDNGSHPEFDAITLKQPELHTVIQNFQTRLGRQV